MAKSVSNDALWEKLSEIEKKVVEALTAKRVSDTLQNRQVEVSTASKKEIIETIKEEIRKYGQSNVSYFEANEKNIKILYNSILKTQKQNEQTNQAQIQNADVLNKSSNKNKSNCFNCIFFRAKKTSVIITALGLLVFILTLFCMKQQNDYSMLMNEHHWQNIVIKQMRIEKDSIRNESKGIGKDKR